jgi:hypothetical protein
LRLHAPGELPRDFASPPLDDIALTLVIRLLCIASNTHGSAHI